MAHINLKVFVLYFAVFVLATFFADQHNMSRIFTRNRHSVKFDLRGLYTTDLLAFSKADIMLKNKYFSRKINAVHVRARACV